MHRESITEALLGTVLVFNTVFKMPGSDPLFVQIFGAGVVFVMLYKLLENVRKWEEKIKKSPPGGNPGGQQIKNIHCHFKAER